MLFAQYMCCSPSMEVQIEETGNRKQDSLDYNCWWPVPTVIIYCLANYSIGLRPN